jgi:type 1 fimbria pilin
MMKNFNKKILLLFAFVLLNAQVLLASDLAENIKKGITNGNVDAFKENLDQTCTVVIGGNSNTVNQIQAELLIHNFFTQHTPTSFVLSSEGTSTTSKNKYVVGKLTTANGTYDVYITLDLNNETIIKEIRFEQA